MVTLALASACGSTDAEHETTLTGGAAGSGALGGGGSGGSELGGSAGGIVLSDAAPPSFDGPDLADAGWFDCDGCACNGATHYCLVVDSFPFLPNAPPPPDAASCDTAAGSGCTPLPADCLEAPSCSCIPPKYGGGCDCSDDGGGLRMYCVLP